MPSAPCILIPLLTAALIACGDAPPAAAPAPPAESQPAAPKAEPQPSAAATQEPAVRDTPAPQADSPAREAPPAEQPRAAEQAHKAPNKTPAATKPAEAPAATKTAEAPAAEPAAPAPPPAAPIACGEKNQPRCPLQGWMEKHMQDALDASDLATVAKGLTQLARLAPDPSWNGGETGWSELAKAGATSAANGDTNAVKQTCKSCHKTWRSKYKQSAFRARPLP